MRLLRQLNTLLTRCLTLAVLAAPPALAGEFYERNGAALGGHDAVSYVTDHQAVPGNTSFTHVYKGSTFRFVNAANRDAFAANPHRYAPQYDGFCAYGVTRGYKAAADPAAFAVVDGKLYLNYNRDVQKSWAADAKSHIVTADSKWSEVAKVTKVIE